MDAGYNLIRSEIESQAAAGCPCGRLRGGKALSFAACCGPVLAGAAAADPEALMRSRYTAFVLGDRQHLLATWHPSWRPAALSLDAADRWLGLDVRSQRSTGPDAAEVEFVARVRQPGGRAVRIQERSRFVREAGRWLYTDGVVPAP